MSARLGYACINTTLRPKNIFSSRTLTLKSLEQKGIAEAKRLSLLNIADTIKIIEWNEAHGIRFFRISSGIICHLSNELIYENAKPVPPYTVDFAKEELAKLGDVVRKYGHRVTMHPGQYNQLGTPHADVLRRTFKDLNSHAEILLAMGMRPTLGSVLIVHGGGSFGDKAATLERWATNFMQLPPTTRQFIVLENDERQYTVMDLLPVCERLNIPLCVDFFHHECSVKLGIEGANFDIYDPKLIARVMQTWYRRGIVPKCHLSEQQKPVDGQREHIGAHADDIKKIPKKLLDIAHQYNIDIMLESKNKELTVIKLHKKYFTENISETEDGIRTYYTLRK